MESGQPHIFVDLLDAVGVRAGVVGEFDAGTAAEFLLFVVYMREVDGQIAGLGDGVVSGFPLVDGLAGAFRADDKNNLLIGGINLVDYSHHHFLRILAVYREAAHSAKKQRDREEESLIRSWRLIRF